MNETERRHPPASDLERFRRAQETVYGQALGEIRGGKKQTHWMWFIFPQLRGLGESYMSTYYGIADADEARRYLADEVLSARLCEISEAMLSVTGKTATAILGPIDARKLFSSMTLFDAVSTERDTVFARVLDRYYGGERDSRTLRMLSL